MNFRYLNYRFYQFHWRWLFPFLASYCIVRNYVVFFYQRHHELKKLKGSTLPFKSFTVILRQDSFVVKELNDVKVNFELFYVDYGMGSYHTNLERFQNRFKRIPTEEKKILCIELGMQDISLEKNLEKFYEYLWNLKLDRQELSKVVFTHGNKTSMRMTIGRTPDQLKSRIGI